MDTFRFLAEKLSLLNIFEIISSIERTGIVHITGAIPECVREKVLARAETLEYTHLVESNTYGVEQHMDSAKDVTQVSPFGEVAEEIGIWLTYRFGLISGWEHMRLHFDDIAVQRYKTCPVGISPHRDSNVHIKLIALLSLAGMAKFSTCRERNIGTSIKTLHTRPGDIVLMRAPGFAGPSDDERPFHSVYDITGPRYLAALRVKRKELR